jgi:hypothetical protein
LAGAAAVAAVVEEQDVEASVVEQECTGECVRDGSAVTDGAATGANGAVGAVEDEDSGSGGGVGGEPPAIELRLARDVVGEVKFVEGEIECGWSGFDGA